MIDEAELRRRLTELKSFRALGLRNQGDIDKFHADLAKRQQIKLNVPHWSGSHGRGQNGRSLSATDMRRSVGSIEPEGSRGSREPDSGPSGSSGPARKPPKPLDLANSPALHLLTPPEQTLCAQLRILPTPYLTIKETLIREYARRGGKLRRREARELVKIDVNKTSRVWDFLVQAGYLSLGTDATANAVAANAAAQAAQASTGGGQANAGDGSSAAGSSTLSAPSLNRSPSKDTQAANSPRPSFTVPAALSAAASLPSLPNGLSK
jgi:transcriptional adapter 2-alpha